MSNKRAPIELPEDKQRLVERAKKLELWSLGMLISIVIVMALVMGSSQAMKTMWLEDLLSLVPTSAVLLGIHFRRWQPDDRFNYGYHRAMQIGFLAGAVTLVGFGAYLLGEAIYGLVTAHHPTISTVSLFGSRVWLGWLMIAALVYASVPPYILGRLKRPLADELHDKAL